jgi:hypothetical protein
MALHVTPTAANDDTAAHKAQRAAQRVVQGRQGDWLALMVVGLNALDL